MAVRDQDGRKRKFEAELDLVLQTHPTIGVWPPDWREQSDYSYAYRKRELLVADRDLPRALDTLTKSGESVEPLRSMPIGVTVVRLKRDEVGPTLDKVDGLLGPGVVTPNHVLSVCPKDGMCPATEPLKPLELKPWPAVAASSEGQGVRVAVVDTGFLEEWQGKEWLDGVIVNPADIETPDSWPNADGYIDPYAGHGTFIAGVIRCIAPGSEVSVEQVIDQAGVVDEAALVEQLHDALGKSPDVISFSAGGYTRGNLPPTAFIEFYENRLRHHKGVVLVAAAGNDGVRDPFWPAAFPWAVSVGALDESGRNRAHFSNFGGWVDVYAPGVDLVNAYATGEYKSVVDPSDITKFEGMCKWSGTSFSTPVVSALIAARMARTGENGQLAAKKLLRAARIQSTPGVGPRLWF